MVTAINQKSPLLTTKVVSLGRNHKAGMLWYRNFGTLTAMIHNACEQHSVS